jgi:organic hydroperoxide reductase OsmC/OhrA
VTAAIGENDGGNQLAVDILAVFTGVEQDAADKLVAEAHQICPYSKATRGNIEVNVSAKAE